jgi:hypothetical protein
MIFEVNALKIPPIPSIVEEIVNESLYFFEPLNAICSKKCAIPLFCGVSYRLPAQQAE